MRPIMTAFTLALLSVIACGDWVEVRPSSAQDDPGSTGGGTATGGAANTCDCPTPRPPRLVELERVLCVGGVASFNYFGLDFRERAFTAWIGPVDETEGQEHARVEWDPELGVFVRCPLEEEREATLWGFE